MIKVFKYLKDKLNTIKDLSGNKEIIRLTYLFSAIFFALICYVLIVVYRDSASIINNSYNKREELYAKKTVRGSILSSNKEVLAYTDTSDSNTTVTVLQRIVKVFIIPSAFYRRCKTRSWVTTGSPLAHRRS